MNIRLLTTHKQDLCADFTLMQSDIICINETWIAENSNLEEYRIKPYTLFLANKGRGKGAAIFVNENIVVTSQNTISSTM